MQRASVVQNPQAPTRMVNCPVMCVVERQANTATMVAKYAIVAEHSFEEQYRVARLGGSLARSRELARLSQSRGRVASFAGSRSAWT